MPAPTGGHTVLYYKYEDQGFTQDPSGDEDPKPFGGNASMSNMEGSNNAVDVFEPNSREKAQIIEQHFDGAATIDFEITNPWWLASVIADAGDPTDNGDGSYTYSFDGDVPLPMRVFAGYEDVATADGEGPALRELVGFVAGSATVETSVEDTATCSLTGAYVEDEIDDTISDLPDQPTLDHDVMTFVDAMLQLDGQTISLVQDASVEIENNVDIIRELGTRFGVDYSPKARDPSVDYTKVQVDLDEVKDMYGDRASTSTQETVDDGEDMTFVLDNGASAGSGINSLQFNLGGQFPDSHSTENLGDPQEDLQESINRRLKTVDAEATNETSAMP